MRKFWAAAIDGKKEGNGDEVGLFFPLPKGLAVQFPSLGEEDKSPPHTTFLYVGSVPKERQSLFLNICTNYRVDFKPAHLNWRNRSSRNIWRCAVHADRGY